LVSQGVLLKAEAGCEKLLARAEQAGTIFAARAKRLLRGAGHDFLALAVRAVLMTAVAGAALAQPVAAENMFDPPPAISVSLPNPTVVVSQTGCR